MSNQYQINLLASAKLLLDYKFCLIITKLMYYLIYYFQVVRLSKLIGYISVDI